MSRSVRVYVPATWDDVALLAGGRGLPAGRPALAVTDALAAQEPDLETEKLEGGAMAAAAAASLRMVADALVEGGPVVSRRVVVAADVPAREVTPDLDAPSGAGSVLLAAALPSARVASVHVDEAAAADDVRAAARTSHQGGAGLLDLTDDHDLLWYATQELADLLAGRV